MCSKVKTLFFTNVQNKSDKVLYDIRDTFLFEKLFFYLKMFQWFEILYNIYQIL